MLLCPYNIRVARLKEQAPIMPLQGAGQHPENSPSLNALKLLTGKSRSPGQCGPRSPVETILSTEWELS